MLLEGHLEARCLVAVKRPSPCQAFRVLCSHRQDSLRNPFVYIPQCVQSVSTSPVSRHVTSTGRGRRRPQARVKQEGTVINCIDEADNLVKNAFYGLLTVRQFSTHCSLLQSIQCQKGAVKMLKLRNYCVSSELAPINLLSLSLPESAALMQSATQFHKYVCYY